jgi:8-oxo-dGTP pyrophosphatase MutT (NUDIX family)
MALLSEMIQRVGGYTPSRLPFDFPRAAVLLALTDNDSDPELIFTRRASHLNKHSGQVAFPGGKQDPEDESLYKTALREAHEEVGLSPGYVARVGGLSEVVSKHNILVTPFVGVVPRDVVLRANPDEIESIFKVPVSYFLENLPQRVDKIKFRNIQLKVPCYFYEGYEIWGMSAIVLVDFLNVALDAKISI